MRRDGRMTNPLLVVPGAVVLAGIVLVTARRTMPQDFEMMVEQPRRTFVTRITQHDLLRRVEIRDYLATLGPVDVGDYFPTLLEFEWTNEAVNDGGLVSESSFRTTTTTGCVCGAEINGVPGELIN